LAAAKARRTALGDGVSVTTLEEDGVRVGLVSDTHGLLRPEALAALAGSDAIVHAGDIGSGDVLEALAQIAPLHAVRGNNDGDAWASSLPETLTVDFGGRRLYVLLDVSDLRIDPRSMNIDVVVSGHSHRPRCERRNGVLFVNPGSAGPRRFSLPVCVAQLSIRAKHLDAVIVTLDVAPPRRRAAPASMPPRASSP
jgi:putative phosphoesterase